MVPNDMETRTRLALHPNPSHITSICWFKAACSFKASILPLKSRTKVTCRTFGSFLGTGLAIKASPKAMFLEVLH